jgi:hypothetical protein
VADTTRPLLVWEKPYYPTYYFSVADVRTELLEADGGVARSPSRDSATRWPGEEARARRPSGHRALARRESAVFTGPSADQPRPSPPPPARANASRGGSAARAGPARVATSPKAATNTATISPAW